MIDSAVEKWRASGKYLPRFMRDFHDQKDVFKAIHDTVAVDKHDYCKDVSWISGQCYVVDIFLWHMARHGYTLQRSPKKIPFDEIEQTTATAKERRVAIFAAIMSGKPSDATALPSQQRGTDGPT